MYGEYYENDEGAPRWTYDEWQMLTSAVWNSRNDTDPHRLATICKVHNVPRRTYARLVKMYTEGGEEYTSPPVLSRIDVEADRLTDECEDTCHLLRVWMEVAENIAHSINEELNPETTDRPDRDNALPILRARLDAIRSGLSKGFVRLSSI